MGSKPFKISCGGIPSNFFQLEGRVKCGEVGEIMVRSGKEGNASMKEVSSRKSNLQDLFQNQSVIWNTFEKVSGDTVYRPLQPF